MRRTRFLTGALLLLAPALPGRADDWPQWMGPRRDDVWRETGILDKFPEGGPKILWRAPVAGGYSGPAVADGRVYVTDFLTDADVRAQSNPATRPKLTGKERVLCLDAKSGKELWTHAESRTYAISYPAGPRCTPTVDGGKVYALGAMGNLLCLDAVKGDVLWSKDFPKDYGAKPPVWGFAGHPLVDGKRLFCVAGGAGSVAVAFDKDTGKELWRSLSAEQPGYSSPTLVETGGRRQLLIWDAENLNSLDPETGKLYWTVPLKPNYGMSIMSPRAAGDLLFVGGFGKSVVLKLDADKPAVTEVWRSTRTTGLSPINATPFVEGGTIYGADQPGPFRAVDLATGKHLWETNAPTTGKDAANSGTAFVTKNGDRFFLFSETGDLIIARLSPKGYDEVSRTRLIAPTGLTFGRDVVWTHPAFADKCVFARNDKEIVCASLAR